jgi:hypothetical protein
MVRRIGDDCALPYPRATLFKGANANYKFYPVPLGVQLQYRMRAWNLNTVDWEVWTSVGSPNLNPPSGDPVTNVTLIGVWES